LAHIAVTHLPSQTKSTKLCSDQELPDRNGGAGEAAPWVALALPCP